jgi:NAD-dependent histone deacetylase SIR2
MTLVQPGGVFKRKIKQKKLTSTLNKKKDILIKIESSEEESKNETKIVKIESDDEITVKLENIKTEEDINDQFGKNINDIDILPSQSKDSMQKNLNTLNYILQHYKLTNELPKYEITRKPRLKFRPPPCTVLNLLDLNFQDSLEDQIEVEDLYFLHFALVYAKKTVVITGAGISVNSGIPDFRSSDGLFQGLSSKSTGSGKNLFDYNVFRNSESIGKFEKMIEKLYSLSQTSKPSPFHLMINEISEQNRLLRLYTQNIDCLDSELSHLKTEIPLTFDKNSNPKTVQLHGSVKLLNCSKCNYISELNDNYFENKKLGESRLIRSCPSCEEMNIVRQVAGKRVQNTGILRPRIVLYNEFHPDGEIIGTITEKDLKSKPDCLIITGTTLKIPGVRRLVKEMAKTVHSNKGYVIWINIDEPPQNVIDYVEYFDLIVVGDCQLIPGLVKYYDYLNPNINKTIKKKKVKKS